MEHQSERAQGHEQVAGLDSPTPKAFREGEREPRTGVRLGVLVVGALLSLAAVATAAGEAGRDKAALALASVKSDNKAAEVAREPAAKAQKALDRGADARKTGDTHHADQLDALALEWAETAVDTARAAELETRASLAEKETAELEARAKRALSLIEQTVARRGRARERLLELGVDPERTPEGAQPTLEKPTPEKPTRAKPTTAAAPQAAPQQAAPQAQPQGESPKKDGAK